MAQGGPGDGSDLDRLQRLRAKQAERDKGKFPSLGQNNNGANDFPRKKLETGSSGGPTRRLAELERRAGEPPGKARDGTFSGASNEGAATTYTTGSRVWSWVTRPLRTRRSQSSPDRGPGV
jgi:hypothetical protein